MTKMHEYCALHAGNVGLFTYFYVFNVTFTFEPDLRFVVYGDGVMKLGNITMLLL